MMLVNPRMLLTYIPLKSWYLFSPYLLMVLLIVRLKIAMYRITFRHCCHQLFSSDPLLNMKWANGKLENNNPEAYKPDFRVLLAYCRQLFFLFWKWVNLNLTAYKPVVFGLFFFLSSYIKPTKRTSKAICERKENFVCGCCRRIFQGKFGNNNPKAYKPDFQGYNLSGNAKCIVLIAEFKPLDQNSYVESDLLKLGKQVKLTLNKVVSDGVVRPKVCGVLCESSNLSTYVMDLASPQVYRMINVTKVKLFVNLSQISLLPRLIAHLMRLKNIALETALKIETAVVSSFNTLKRPSPSPPLNWLSNDSYVLSRSTKKQKK